MRKSSTWISSSTPQSADASCMYATWDWIILDPRRAMVCCSVVPHSSTQYLRFLKASLFIEMQCLIYESWLSNPSGLPLCRRFLILRIYNLLYTTENYREHLSQRFICFCRQFSLIFIPVPTTMRVSISALSLTLLTVGILAAPVPDRTFCAKGCLATVWTDWRLTDEIKRLANSNPESEDIVPKMFKKGTCKSSTVVS